MRKSLFILAFMILITSVSVSASIEVFNDSFTDNDITDWTQGGGVVANGNTRHTIDAVTLSMYWGGATQKGSQHEIVTLRGNVFNFTFGYYMIGNTDIYVSLLVSGDDCAANFCNEGYGLFLEEGATDTVYLKKYDGTAATTLNSSAQTLTGKWSMYRNETGYIKVYRNNVLVFTSAIDTTYSNFTSISVDGTDAVATTNKNDNFSVQGNPDAIYSCTGLDTIYSTHRALDFYLKDEETNAALTGDFEATFEVFNGSTAVGNYSFDLTGLNNYSICINSSTATYNTDAYIKYTTDNGFTHKYFLQNATINSTTQTINLYNFNTTTGITDLKGTIRYKTTYNYFENVIAQLQRYYVDSDVWRTVQMDKSGDFGLIFFNIIEESADYRLRFYDSSNNLLKETERMSFICTSGVCDLTFLLDPYEATAVASGLEISQPTYHNDTKILNFTWNETLGGTSTVETLVTLETYTGTSILCNTTQTGSSGTATCNLTGETGQAFIKVTGDDAVYYSEWLTLAKTTFSDVVGEKEAAFWAFGLSLTIMIFGVIISPVAALITMIIALIVIFYFGLLTPLTTLGIIVITIIAIAAGLKIRS